VPSETTTANPELLQTQVASLLVQPLEAASVVLASGVRIFDTSGPLRIPKLTSGASVGWVEEGGLIPEADVDFGEVTLMPSNRTSLKVLLRFTNELLRQSVIGLDATLKQRLVTDVSNVLDTALLTGDGTDHSVTGIIHQAEVQTGALDVTDANCLLDAIALASAAEVTPNRWFVNGQDFIAMRKLSKFPVVYAELPGAQHAFVIFGSPRAHHAADMVGQFLSWVYATRRSTAR
jgi:HK97 family phage major capsid protein